MWFAVYLLLLSDHVWELREFAQEGMTELVKESPYFYGPKLVKIFNETESPEVRFRLRIPCNHFVKKVNEYKPDSPVWPSYDQIHLVPFESLGNQLFILDTKKKYDNFPERTIARIVANRVYYPFEPYNCYQRIVTRDWIRGLLIDGTLTEKQATSILSAAWERELKYYSKHEEEMKGWRWHDGITSTRYNYYGGR